MDLTPFLDGIRRDLGAAADLAGPEAGAAAERLVAALDSAVRLALLDALSAAAGEITREIAPGAVEVRLRGRDPEFVVTAPPPQEHGDDEPEPFEETDEGDTARITLRLPESLKGRIEAAAARERVSVNTWLVRALSGAVSGSGRGRRGGPGFPGFPGQSFQGWVR